MQGDDFTNLQLSDPLAQQCRYRAQFTLDRGSFYSGHKTTFGASGGRVRVTNQFSLDPGYSINQVRLQKGDSTTHLLTTRATYSMSPTSFVSALMQYNSSGASLSTNARLRWEYQPGSELFIVYPTSATLRMRRERVGIVAAGRPRDHVTRIG